jgi:hypothetical protein
MQAPNSGDLLLASSNSLLAFPSMDPPTFSSSNPMPQAWRYQEGDCMSGNACKCKQSDPPPTSTNLTYPQDNPEERIRNPKLPKQEPFILILFTQLLQPLGRDLTCISPYGQHPLNFFPCLLIYWNRPRVLPEEIATVSISHICKTRMHFSYC